MKSVSLDSRLDTQGAQHGHQLVRATRHDLGRSVAVAYAPVVVDLHDGDGDGQGRTKMLVVNACSANRLVLRAPTPVTSGVVRSASGTVIADIGSRGSGLLEIDVPAFGSITVITQP